MKDDPFGDVARLIAHDQADGGSHAPPGPAQLSGAAAVPARLPVIRISPMGGLANRMIQLLAAWELSRRLEAMGFGRLDVVNICLPELGWAQGYASCDDAATHILSGQVIDAEAAAAALHRGAAMLDLRSYAQQMVNLPPLPAARALLPDQGHLPSAGEDSLLCVLRQGEILDARHPDYVLIPPLFYADLAAATGKRIIFMGQCEDTPYTAALRATLPGAEFWPSAGAIEDFSRIRRARHIVPAISTFAWLAAWLSDASSIHLPVLGLFHPGQAPATMLLPRGDARYRFWRFPFHYAVPLADLPRAHASLTRCWVETSTTALPCARPAADLAALLRHFEEGEYLTLHADVAASVAAGGFPSGLHHFTHHGFAEGREGFALDPAEYCTAYPLAALELSLGLYRDPWHHFAQAGSARGYARVPPRRLAEGPPARASQSAA